MFKRASFKNFKGLRDVSLELGRMTVLIGPNASGKSSVLDGIHLASQLALPHRWRERDIRGPFADLLEGAAHLRTRGESGSLSIAVDISAGSFAIECMANDGGEWHARASFPRPNDSVGVPSREDVRPFFQALPAELGAVVRLRLQSHKLRSPSYSEDEVPRVEHDGAGLASAIAHIAAAIGREAIEAIEADLRAVVPTVGKIRAPRAEVTRRETIVLADGSSTFSDRKVWGNKVEVEVAGAGYLSADLLSDGTLIALALVTLLNGPQVPRVILLDDIESGLHPHAQQELVGVLRKFMTRMPEVQFVLTTHSPYLLDSIEDDEIYALRLNDNGHTVCRKLCEHPDWARWRGKMKMGEFWSTVGEDWVPENAAE